MTCLINRIIRLNATASCIIERIANEKKDTSNLRIKRNLPF